MRADTREVLTPVSRRQPTPLVLTVAIPTTLSPTTAIADTREVLCACGCTDVEYVDRMLTARRGVRCVRPDTHLTDLPLTIQASAEIGVVHLTATLERTRPATVAQFDFVSALMTAVGLHVTDQLPIDESVADFHAIQTSLRGEAARHERSANRAFLIQIIPLIILLIIILWFVLKTF